MVLAQTQTRTGPADKLAATLAEGDGAPLPHWLEQQRYCLEKTEALLDPAEFHRAVQAIVEARRVFVYAKNASRSMAELLRFRLRRIGVDVRLLAGAGNELLEGLAAAGPGDLVVVFSFSKRSTEGAILLDWQREAGYRTLLFTGQLSSSAGPRSPTFGCRLPRRGKRISLHGCAGPPLLRCAGTRRIGQAWRPGGGPAGPAARAQTAVHKPLIAACPARPDAVQCR